MYRISSEGIDEAMKVMLRDGVAKIIFRVVTTPDDKIGFDGLSELQAQFLEAGRIMQENDDEGALKEASFCCDTLRHIEDRWDGVSTKDLDVDDILSSIARSLNVVFKDKMLMAERADDENGPCFAFVLGPSVDTLRVMAHERSRDDSMDAALRSRAHVPDSQLN